MEHRRLDRLDRIAAGDWETPLRFTETDLPRRVAEYPPDALASLARVLAVDNPFVDMQPAPPASGPPSEWMDWPATRLPTTERERVREALSGILSTIQTYGGGNQAIGPREARSAFAKIEAHATAGLEAVKP